LIAISRARRIPINWDATTDQLAAYLRDRLVEPGILGDTIQRLSGAEGRLLVEIHDAGGVLPRAYVETRHGPVRPFRPWRAGDPRRPWEAPASPTEHLYYMGLVFACDDDLVLPDELGAYLAACPLTLVVPALDSRHPRATPSVDLAPGSDSGASVYPSPNTGAAYAAIHDVAMLLATLDRHDVRPIAGPVAWLPPRALAFWGARCAVVPGNPNARSEARTHRRRWLHFLAEGGHLAIARHGPVGLIGMVGALLKPTIAGHVWLDQPPDAQWQALVAALTPLDVVRWRALRLPGHALPIPPDLLVGTVIRELAREPFADAEAFAARLRTRDAEIRARLPALDDDAALTGVVAEIVQGPLAWLGISAPALGGTFALSPNAVYWPELQPLPALPPPEPWRAHLAGGSDPQDAPDALVLSRPASSPPVPGHRYWLEVSGSLSAGPPGGRLTYRITASTFTAALHRGHALPALATGIAAALDRPLNRFEQGAIRSWADAAGGARVHLLPVLEVLDPAVIQRIAAHSRRRPLIRRTLSPRAAVVDPARLPVIARRLGAILGASPDVPRPPDARSPDTPPGEAAAQHLWLAARVYQAIGRWTPLPARLPEAAFDQLAAGLSPAARAAADGWAEAVVADLARVIDGWPAYPAWADAPDPGEDRGEPSPGALADPLATLREAVDTGQPVEIDYYTAGRGERSRRVVEPFRVEWRGRTPYFVGWCRHAQGERVFRVDRILGMRWAPSM